MWSVLKFIVACQNHSYLEVLSHWKVVTAPWFVPNGIPTTLLWKLKSHSAEGRQSHNSYKWYNVTKENTCIIPALTPLKAGICPVILQL